MATVKRNYGKNGELVSIRLKVYKGVDTQGKQLPEYRRTVKVPKGLTAKKQEKFIEEQALLFEQECKVGFGDLTRKTFASYADYVIELKEQEGVKHSTLSRYKEILERVNKEIGHLKLTDIRPMHLNKLYKKLGQPGENMKDPSKGLSAKTIREHHRVISTVMQTAYKEMLIKENPAARATPPKTKKKEPNYLQIEDLEKVRECIEYEPIKWKAALYILMTTGMRRGELLGLRWTDIDFDNNVIHIVNNILYTKEKGVYEDTPKTESSKRYIPLLPYVKDILIEYKEWQDAEAERLEGYWNTTGYLFTKQDGTVMHPDSVSDYFGKFSKRHGLPKVNPHAFRHTLASVLIAEGEDVVTTSNLLGHSNVSHTTDIYSHVIEKAKVRATGTITEKILGVSEAKPEKADQKSGQKVARKIKKGT